MKKYTVIPIRNAGHVFFFISSNLYGARSIPSNLYTIMEKYRVISMKTYTVISKNEKNTQEFRKTKKYTGISIRNAGHVLSLLTYMGQALFPLTYIPYYYPF